MTLRIRRIESCHSLFVFQALFSSSSFSATAAQQQHAKSTQNKIAAAEMRPKYQPEPGPQMTFPLIDGVLRTIRIIVIKILKLTKRGARKRRRYTTNDLDPPKLEQGPTSQGHFGSGCEASSFFTATD